MKLTRDESRALTFLAGLLALSAVVRIAGTPAPGEIPGVAVDLDAHQRATRAAVDSAERAGTPLEPGERLDPNTAPVVELDRLPRVGPALARRIVAEREANGPFRSASDLDRVPGVGPAMVAALEDRLDFSRAPRMPARGTRTSRAAAPGAPTAANAAAAPAAPVDLNAADAVALTSLPGIGPVLAERIVAYRDSVGRFGDVDALMAVKGVGEATLERIRASVTVGW